MTTSEITLERRSVRPAMSGLTRSKKRYGEWLIVRALFVCALLSVVVTASIVIALLRPAIDFFGDVSIGSFLTGKVWAPLFEPPRFGVRPLIIGTFVVAFCAIVVAIPIGVGIATYLSEYAPHRLRSVLKPLLEILAGIPTVVYGYFALNFISPYVQRWWPFGEKPGPFNALSAGIAIGIMIIPMVASLTEDAMGAVPQALRDGAAALGSTRREISTKVVWPAALSGMVASFILAISRALGETTIVLIAAGSNAHLSFNPGESMQTLSSFIGFAGIGDQPTGSTGYKTIFACGVLLFVMTFIMNYIGIRFVRRFREVYE